MRRSGSGGMVTVVIPTPHRKAVMTIRPGRRAAAAALTLAAVLVPVASAAAATPGNPQVARIDPSTGVVKTLAGGKPFTTLGGIAVSPGGTLYVANQGPIGPAPKGAGLYSLSAPGFGVTKLASGMYPTDVALSGSTLYALDGSNVVSLTPGDAAPAVVSSGGLFSQYGIQPRFGAVSGGTMYVTASGCGSAEAPGGSYVIAVNLATGAQSVVKSFGCTPLGGIAATPAGGLYVALQGKSPRIVSLNPATGAVATLSSGGSLKVPQGITVDPAGDVLVADGTSGVIAVSTQGGDQSPLTNRGAVGGATGIATDAAGNIYITEAGVPPKLVASAASRQRFRTSGIRMSATCSRPCTVGYTANVRIAGATGFAKSAAFRNVSGRRTLRVKLPSQVNRRIASALRGHQRVTAAITVRPQDSRTGAAGSASKLKVRLTAKAAR
jgi:hypothetical protein